MTLPWKDGGTEVQNLGPLVMCCQPPENVPVLSTLAREFAVCTRWFCSVPGETWPNRNFMHAATSDGETNIDDDTPQVWVFPQLWDTADRHAKWFPLDEFARHVEKGLLPAYSFLEPNHRPPLHTTTSTEASTITSHRAAPRIQTA